MVSYVFNGFCGFRCLKMSENFRFFNDFYFINKNSVFGPPQVPKNMVQIGEKPILVQCFGSFLGAPVKACLQPCAGLASAVHSARLCSAVLNWIVFFSLALLGLVFGWARLGSPVLGSVLLPWAPLSSLPARFG